MNVITDTLVWLAHFPAQHGYAMIFIAAFALFGFVRILITSGSGGARRLDELRVQSGEAKPKPNPIAAVVRPVQRIVLIVVAIITIAGGVIGILSLTGVPVTETYIAENGVETTGSYDGTYVTFEASNGNEYTLPVDFFTEPAVGGEIYMLSSDEPVTIIYLEQHPQAFVVEVPESE
ncbi:MAG: hypothetical protein ACTH31_01095 [Pseudoclavibacter sp.]